MDMWGELNERQRHYLQAIYTVDQEKEREQAYIRQIPRLRMGAPKASVWRWINYTPMVGNARLHDLIGKHYIDSGTGSTFEALETRGLIECQHRKAARFGKYNLYVKITKLGRKVVRAHTEPPATE